MRHYVGEAQDSCRCPRNININPSCQAPDHIAFPDSGLQLLQVRTVYVGLFCIEIYKKCQALPVSGTATCGPEASPSPSPTPLPLVLMYVGGVIPMCCSASASDNFSFARQIFIYLTHRCGVIWLTYILCR